jgi:hypothetical protein
MNSIVERHSVSKIFEALQSFRVKAIVDAQLGLREGPQHYHINMDKKMVISR